MPNDFRRKRRVTKGIEAHVEELIGRLALNPAVDKPARLPFNVASLQTEFNAQLGMLLEQNFAEGEVSLWKELLSLDDCKIFSDDETFLFAKIFGDGVGLFGFGETGGNFKILSLCFTKPERRRGVQTLNLVFDAFAKTFLPKVNTSEIVSVLREDHFFTAGGLIFEFVQSGKLNMLDISAE